MTPICGANRINIKKNNMNIKIQDYINTISKIVKESK